jgi:drug/metabolite transporter (DMT)-like permease
MKEIFCGEDGKLSGRRLFGTVFLFVGLAFEIVAQFQTGDWLRFVPGGAAMFVGLLLWGFVTIQNVQDIAKAVKGDK